MNRECSWKRTQETETDLLDLLRRLGRQWKRIAVCALVSAVLAGVGSSLISKHTDEDEAAVQTEPSEEEAEPVPLTKEEQKRGVAAACQLAAETAELEEYIKNSVLMQMDPYHKNTVQLIFRIEGADGWMTQKIVEKYLDYLAGDRAAEDICKTDSRMEHLERRFLSELYQAAQKAGGTYTDEEGYARSGVLLSVDVTGSDQQMAEALAADIRTILEAYHPAVKKECAGHTLILLGSETKERADSDLLSWQREKRTLLASDQENLKTMKEAFDDTQKALYAAAESGSESVAGQNPDTEEQEAGQNPDTDGQVSGQNPEEIRGRVSLLYVLFGFFGGIFIYGAVYTGWYLLCDTVKSAGEFRLNYTFPFYGTVCPPGSRKKDSTGEDVYERQKEQLLYRIRFSCSRQNIARLCLAADFLPDTEEKACMDSMVSQLRQWGIDAVFAENTGQDASAWDILADVGTVMMVCRIGRTTHRMVDDAMGFYQENGIAVLGAAALES